MVPAPAHEQTSPQSAALQAKGFWLRVPQLGEGRNWDQQGSGVEARVAEGGAGHSGWEGGRARCQHTIIAGFAPEGPVLGCSEASAWGGRVWTLGCLFIPPLWLQLLPAHPQETHSALTSKNNLTNV